MFAFIFDSVGAGEWLVLLAVMLVVMGPKRLPSTARTLGQYYSRFRRAAESFKRQLMDLDTEFDQAVRDAERQAQEAFTVEEDGAKDSPQPETSEKEKDGDQPHPES